MAAQSPAAQVRHIPVEAISPNPHNPRRLFDEEPMRILKESIHKLGILVPVTLYEEAGRARNRVPPYVLLDGERRWRCAKELGLKRVPAIIVEKPSEAQNILTMFHIHNLREGWQLMPTALKLHTLMERLGVHNERKLSELTKLSIPQIRRCRILLTYPKRFQNLMLAPPTERLKADFFIELHRIRGPALAEGFPPWVERGDSECIQRILDKYQNNIIKAVTDFRRLAEVYRASVKLRRERTFMKKLGEFLDEPKARIADVEVPGATFEKEAKEIRRTARRLLTQLSDIELEQVSSDKTTIGLLKRLVKILQKKLDEALLTGPQDVAAKSD